MQARKRRPRPLQSPCRLRWKPPPQRPLRRVTTPQCKLLGRKKATPLKAVLKGKTLAKVARPAKKALAVGGAAAGVNADAEKVGNR